MTTEDDAVIEKVAERLKFFFSDANIRADRFMQKQMRRKGKGKGDNNELSGSVSIATLISFNSIKRHTTSVETVAKAAKTLGDLLQVTDDEKAIKRVVPFHLSQMNDNLPLSLMVKDLPVTEGERPKYAVTVDQIKKLFDVYGDVVLIKLRYKPKEEASDEDAKDTADKKEEGNDKSEKDSDKMDDEKTQDKEIKEDDGEEKEQDKEKKEVDKENPSGDTEKTNGGGAGRRPKRIFVPAGKAQVEFANKEQLEKAAAECLTIKAGEDIEPKKKLELGGNTLRVQLLEEAIKKKYHAPPKKPKGAAKTGEPVSNKRNHDEMESELTNAFTFDWKPGCVISLKGLGGECDREAIRDAICKALGITEDDVKEQKIYTDYSRGQTTGAIRFNEPGEQIKQLCDKLAGGELEIAGAKVESATLLEGDEEKQYWKNFIDFKNQQMKNDSTKKRKRHRSR